MSRQLAASGHDNADGDTKLRHFEKTALTSEVSGLGARHPPLTATSPGWRGR